MRQFLEQRRSECNQPIRTVVGRRGSAATSRNIRRSRARSLRPIRRVRFPLGNQNRKRQRNQRALSGHSVSLNRPARQRTSHCSRLHFCRPSLPSCCMVRGPFPNERKTPQWSRPISRNRFSSSLDFTPAGWIFHECRLPVVGCFRNKRALRCSDAHCKDPHTGVSRCGFCCLHSVTTQSSPSVKMMSARFPVALLPKLCVARVMALEMFVPPSESSRV